MDSKVCGTIISELRGAGIFQSKPENINNFGRNPILHNQLLFLHK